MKYAVVWLFWRYLRVIAWIAAVPLRRVVPLQCAMILEDLVHEWEMRHIELMGEA